MKEITLKLLKKLKACEDGIEWFIEQDTTDPRELFELSITNYVSINGLDTLENANWMLLHFMNETQRNTYEQYALNIHSIKSFNYVTITAMEKYFEYYYCDEKIKSALQIILGVWHESGFDDDAFINILKFGYNLVYGVTYETKT
jgi:hypothetical protein